MLSEILVSSACTTRSGGLAGATVAGLIDWRVALAAVSVVFVLAVAAADLLAFECWKRSHIGIEVTGASGGAPGRTGWMSLAGLLLNTFFLIGILFAAIPLFWLTGCGG